MHIYTDGDVWGGKWRNAIKLYPEPDHETKEGN